MQLILDFPDPHLFEDYIDEDQKKMLINEFGSIKAAIEQSLKEIANLKSSLSTIVSNRIPTINEEKIPFYKILNKLKHGYQVVEDKKEEVLSILIDLVESSPTSSRFTVLEIPIKLATIKFFAEETKKMILPLKHILLLYTIKTYQ